MIRRDILDNASKVLADFDWFNDFKDTRLFLQGLGSRELVLLKRLDEGNAAWLKAGGIGKSKREHRAAELMAKFPKLKIGQEGEFCNLGFRRISPRLYVMTNDPLPESRNHGLKHLALSKKDLVNWFNDAPIQLHGTLTKPDGSKVDAVVDVDAITGQSRKLTEVQPAPWVGPEAPAPTMDTTQLDEEALCKLGTNIVDLIARGHTVEIVPCFRKFGDKVPAAYSVKVPTLAFIGAVPLDELPELVAMATADAIQRES